LQYDHANQILGGRVIFTHSLTHSAIHPVPQGLKFDMKRATDRCAVRPRCGWHAEFLSVAPTQRAARHVCYWSHYTWGRRSTS